jgi:lipid-A-disaccharide synthase-like uncharacterized protein
VKRELEDERMSSLTFWLTIGFLGQAIFTARFLVQWMVSERRQDSVVPVAFWWLSLLGGVTLLAYAVFRRDPVIITGQSMGLVVYTRNLMLVNKANGRREQCRRGSADEGLCSIVRRAEMSEI